MFVPRPSYPVIRSVCSLSPSDRGDFYTVKRASSERRAKITPWYNLSFCTAVREEEAQCLWNRWSRRHAFPFWGECFQVAWNLQLCGLMKDCSMPKVLHVEIAPSALLSRIWYPFPYFILYFLFCHKNDKQAKSYCDNLPLLTCSQTTSFGILVYYQLLFLFHSEAMQHHPRTMKLSQNWEQWGLLCIVISHSCYLYTRAVLWKQYLV